MTKGKNSNCSQWNPFSLICSLRISLVPVVFYSQEIISLYREAKLHQKQTVNHFGVIFLGDTGYNITHSGQNIE